MTEQTYRDLFGRASPSPELTRAVLAAEGPRRRGIPARRLAAIGYTLSDSRGDWRPEGAPEAEE